MPFASIRGISVRYEVFGDSGPWIALSPGGRNPLEEVGSLAATLAIAGYRVVLHDRRNCGASDVVIDGDESEYEIWADDLHALLQLLGGLPAYVGGCSSGARLSLLLALRHPRAVRGLLLWRVTGGRRAAERLSEKYYGQYIKLAEQGGMAAVCESQEFRERIEERPENRKRLMNMDPQRFISVMSHWRQYFDQGSDMPVLGVREEQLQKINVPACVIPGNDKSHPREVGETLSRLLPHGELCRLELEDMDVDVCPHEEWHAEGANIAKLFTSFLSRVS